MPCLSHLSGNDKAIRRQETSLFRCGTRLTLPMICHYGPLPLFEEPLSRNWRHNTMNANALYELQL
jgi:hypothetical protein